MNTEKILVKLKKRKMYRSMGYLINIYMLFNKPSIKNIKCLSHHCPPHKLRKWLSNKSSHLEKKETNKLQKHIDLFDRDILPKTKEKLKIAVCISGEPRSFEHCINSFKRFFHGHNISIFIASKSEENLKLIRENYLPHSILQYNDPDFSDLEKAGIKKFGFIKRKNNVFIPQANPNLYPMWYGIKQSFIALEQATPDISEFDAICRCRFDTFFKRPLPNLDFTKNTIYIDPNYNEHGGYSDQFAIGNPECMQDYFMLYDWFNESLEYSFGDKGYLPERVLKIYLEDKCHIKTTEIKFETRLLRDEFIGLLPHQIPIKGMITNTKRNEGIQNYIKNKYPNLHPH